jgi:hypothetical protein
VTPEASFFSISLRRFQILLTASPLAWREQD